MQSISLISGWTSSYSFFCCIWLTIIITSFLRCLLLWITPFYRFLIFINIVYNERDIWWLRSFPPLQAIFYIQFLYNSSETVSSILPLTTLKLWGIIIMAHRLTGRLRPLCIYIVYVLSFLSWLLNSLVILSSLTVNSSLTDICFRYVFSRHPLSQNWSWTWCEVIIYLYWFDISFFLLLCCCSSNVQPKLESICFHPCGWNFSLQIHIVDDDDDYCWPSNNLNIVDPLCRSLLLFYFLDYFYFGITSSWKNLWLRYGLPNYKHYINYF